MYIIKICHIALPRPKMIHLFSPEITQLLSLNLGFRNGVGKKVARNLLKGNNTDIMIVMILVFKTQRFKERN